MKHLSLSSIVIRTALAAILLAAVPFMAAAAVEGTDLQQGAQTSISEPQGKPDPVVRTGGTMPAPNPGGEGTDLQKGSKTGISSPSGKPDPAVETGKSMPQRDPGGEGTDLQKDAESTIK